MASNWRNQKSRKTSKPFSSSNLTEQGTGCTSYTHPDSAISHVGPVTLIITRNKPEYYPVMESLRLWRLWCLSYSFSASTGRQMSSILIKSNHLVASNTFNGLHLSPYGPITEFTSSRLVHAQSHHEYVPIECRLSVDAHSLS